MYKYLNEREAIFTEEGQRGFLRVRDNVKKLLKLAGAFQMINAWDGVIGDTDKMMAYVDRLVELKEIEELTDSNYAGQFRVFIEVK